MCAVIQFSADGTGKAVYTETLPLSEIGSLAMQRDSTVEFNANNQQWEVRLTSNPEAIVYSHQLRSECIKWEVNKLNEDLMK